MNELEIGKVPPQAIDLEEAVLGALMLENKAMLYIQDILKAECFYKESHQIIFSAINRLYKKSNPVDILTVTNELKRVDQLELVGGAFEVTRLTNNISSSENTEYHSRIIYQKYLNRELIAIASDMIKNGFDDSTDSFELLERTQERLLSLSNYTDNSLVHIQDCVSDVMKIIDRNIRDENKLTGIPTGFTEFDKHSNGLQKTDLIVIAGETSSGKTSLALNIAKNSACAGFKVGIWSLEMSKNQLTSRLMADASQIPSKRLLMEKLDNEELQKLNSKIKELVEANIFIDDLRSSELGHIERQIRSAKIKHNIDLVVVDYLQLISNFVKGESKASRVGGISNKMKALAKNLDIPVILVSQLSRDKDKPKPSIGRLKESGDIENAADIVWLLWRPEKYMIESFNFKGWDVDSKGLSVHDIAKGRNIGLAKFLLNFNEELTKFTNRVEEEYKIPENETPY